MVELVPISFTFASLAKVLLIIGINTFLAQLWYSPLGFTKQWRQAVQWQEGDQHHSKAVLMSSLATLFNAFLLNILLIAFDIRQQQWVSAILASAILTGFYAVSSKGNCRTLMIISHVSTSMVGIIYFLRKQPTIHAIWFYI